MRNVDRHLGIWISVASNGGAVAMMAAPLAFPSLPAKLFFVFGIAVFVIGTVVSASLLIVERGDLNRGERKPMIGPLLVMGLGAMVFMAGAGWFYARFPQATAGPHPSTQDTPPPTAQGMSSASESVLSAQMREFEDIDKFIGNKDEIALRDTFDLPNILKFNMEFTTKQLVPSLVSQEEAQSMDKFFEGGKARLDIRYAHISSFNNTAQVDWIPGKIGAINTSKKYNDSREKLAKLISISYFPAPVVTALKDLDNAVEENSTLLIEVLNEKFSEDPRNIFFSDKYGSPFYGVTPGLYWKKFVPLRPKADQINSAIRSFLKLN